MEEVPSPTQAARRRLTPALPQDEHAVMRAGLTPVHGTSRVQPPEEMEMSRLDADKRNELDRGQFAFPKQRKEPLEDARHVRNAIARFDQVQGVSDEERDEAWKRIKAAAKKFDVDVSEKSWHELGRKPQHHSSH
jgi:hypothetical protein